MEEWCYFPRLWYTGVYGNTSGEVISHLSPSAWFVIYICSNTIFLRLLLHMRCCVRFLEWAGISFTWPLSQTMCLRRKQHAIVLFMVFHVSLCNLGGTAVTLCFFQGKKNIFPPLFCPVSLLWIIRAFQCSSRLTLTSSQNCTQSFVVSEGRQATTGSRWPVQAWDRG